MNARKSVISFAALYVGLVLVLGACCDPQTTIPSGVTGASVRSLALGMTPEQVLSKTGRPYGRIERTDGTTEWWYSPQNLGYCGRRLTLSLEFRNDKLIGVLAGDDNGGQERQLYALTAERAWEAEDFLRVFPTARGRQ